MLVSESLLWSSFVNKTLLSLLWSYLLIGRSSRRFIPSKLERSGFVANKWAKLATLTIRTCESVTDEAVFLRIGKRWEVRAKWPVALQAVNSIPSGLSSYRVSPIIPALLIRISRRDSLLVNFSAAVFAEDKIVRSK